jgi:hypothetical protein
VIVVAGPSVVKDLRGTDCDVARCKKLDGRPTSNIVYRHIVQEHIRGILNQYTMAWAFGEAAPSISNPMTCQYELRMDRNGSLAFVASPSTAPGSQ